MLALSSTTILSCNKDNTGAELIPVFKVGDTNQYMNFMIYDPPISIVAEPDDFARITIDIDKDGQNDFYVTSTHEISPNGDTSKSVFINIGVSFYFNDYAEDNVLYQCTEILNDSTQIVTNHTELSDFNCMPPGIDSIYNEYSGKEYYPVIHKFGDMVNDDFEWNNKFNLLALHDSSNFMHYDNGILSIIKNDIVRGYWGSEMDNYILTKKDVYGGPYYGWVKLSVRNCNEVVLYGFAFQKY